MLIKLNRRMHTDQRVIVVTDKYMYRLDPSKNFKSKKEHTLVTDIQTASITDQRDQLVVLQIKKMEHDFIFCIDSSNKSQDRVAELCANIHRVAIKLVFDLKHKNLKVKF